MEKKDKHYSPKHDKTVMELAAKEFKISEESANRAFDLAKQAMSNNKKEPCERFIRNKLSFITL